MFDHLSTDERLELRKALFSAADKTSKVTLTLGDVCLKTLDRLSPEESALWATRERFLAMADDFRAMAEKLAIT